MFRCRFTFIMCRFTPTSYGPFHVPSHKPVLDAIAFLYHDLQGQSLGSNILLEPPLFLKIAANTCQDTTKVQSRRKLTKSQPKQTLLRIKNIEQEYFKFF